MNLEKETDLNEMLTDDESAEVIRKFNELKKDTSSMVSIECGSEVRVMVEEGHICYEYCLKVDSIDEEGVDDEGNYYCVAYGTGISEEDKEMAEEFTSRIEPLNFAGVLN